MLHLSWSPIQLFVVLVAIIASTVFMMVWSHRLKNISLNAKVNNEHTPRFNPVEVYVMKKSKMGFLISGILAILLSLYIAIDVGVRQNTLPRSSFNADPDNHLSVKDIDRSDRISKRDETKENFRQRVLEADLKIKQELEK